MSKRSPQRAPAKKREAQRRASRSGSVRRAIATRSRRRLVAAVWVTAALALVGGTFASFRVRQARDARSQSQGAIQPQGLAPNSPSKEYIYAGGRLIATEEPVVTPPPGTPTGLVATFIPPASISLSWNASSGQVTNYEVWRSTNIVAGFGSSPVSSPTGTSFTDSPGSTSRTYIYEVRANGPGGFSSFSNIDFATIYPFANPSPSARSIVRASDINDLRNAIDLVRAAANLGAGSYNTDPGALTNAVHVKAAHISEMRTNLDGAINVFVTNGLPQPPGYTGGLAQGAIVIHDHVSELRGRVK
jgi:hypothetical protein